jgi:hypothetical protein
MPTSRKRNKYHNIKTVVLNKTFDSKKEAARYEELLLLESEGTILNLKTQVTYPFTLNGFKICSYRCDFAYDLPDGTPIVEDVKSVRTAKIPVYRIKFKMMQAFYGITIKEVF